jgi:2-methylcitrate dehydratase PrpD
MLGTIAVLAVQRGFRGDGTILDGKHGYWQMYGSPFFKEDVLLGDLGTVWHLERINFKAYPCCYINHAAIAGIEHLVRENNVKSEDIEEIVVYGDPLHNTPNRWPPQIRTQEDAQFAEAYLYALAASHESTPGPEWQLPSSLSNPRVRDLMPKVKVRLHPKAEEMLTEKAKAGGVTDLFSSIVEISANGKKITTEVSVPKGSPANPMSAAELEDKFRLNASYCLVKRENVDPIIEIISNLEEVDNITKLTRLLNIEE